MNPESSSYNPIDFMTPLLNQPSLKSIDPNSLCLHPYFPTPDEIAILKTQTIQYPPVSNDLISEDPGPVKPEFSPKFEGKYEFIPKPTKVEPSDQDFSYSELSTTASLTSQSLSRADLKAELEKMIRFLLSNMGKDNEALIANTRHYYLHNSFLLEVYDTISMKYFCAKKFKEDLIRYILRKMFRHLRTSIMKKEKVTSKKASLLVCKRYFHQNGELSHIENEDEEKVLKSLMPYNKHSKNKTMNISFILEIFSSPSFCKEYQDFLPKLDTLIVEDNKKKEGNLVKSILECLERNCLEKLGSMHRLPWLDVWMEDAKNLAIAIMPNKRLIYNLKKPKNY